MSKKSFVLYFDVYPHIRRLPAEQRGELLSALFEYAIEAAETPGELSDLLERHPNMTLETGMAFCFIAESIHRDTLKWKAKQSRYVKAAQERSARADHSLRQYVQELHSARPESAVELSKAE